MLSAAPRVVAIRLAISCIRGRARRGRFEDGTFLRRGVILRKESRIYAAQTADEVKFVLVVERNHPFDKAATHLDELAKRNGVEEFIGDEDQRSVSYVGEALEPVDFTPAPASFSFCLSTRRGLVSTMAMRAAPSI